MVTLPELYREREGGGEAEGAVSERGEAGAGAGGQAGGRIPSAYWLLE